MMRQLFTVLFLCVFYLSPVAQTLTFKPVYGNSTLLNQTFVVVSDSIRFETFRFYISGIQFLWNERVVWDESTNCHLIDATDEKSQKLTFILPTDLNYNKIRFNLGIDSTINVAGVMGGDLDPTKGMYWTWQSGYINMKLEGISNLCATPNNAFQFHLGGYLSPFASMQTITLDTKGKAAGVINVDVSKFLENLDLKIKNQVMSPCKEAVELSAKAVKMFSIAP